MATKQKKAAPKADNRAKTLFADVQARAKTAREKSEARRAELVAFNKANLEALKASGRVVSTEGKALVEQVVANAKKQLEAANENRKALAGVKSPKALVELQREQAKAYLEAARADGKAFGEAVKKFAGDVVEPLKARGEAVRAQLKAA